MSNDTPTSQELDMSLLDMEIDSIEDLPGFEVPVNGEYLLKLETSLKAINGKQFIETSYELLECLKQDNDSDLPSKAGSKFSSLFTIKGDGKDTEKDTESVRLGLGKFKELVKGIAEDTGQGNVGLLVRDVLASCIVQCTVKRRADKEDKEKFYPVIKNLKLN